MNHWMNLPQEYRKGKFVILPIEYEKDTTFGIGASKGPQEIIKASEHLEYFDDQFEVEPFEKGIKVLKSLKPKTPEEMVEQVSFTISQQKNKFIIGLGGDHSVTIGMVRGMGQLHENFSVIQFDAHSDLRDSWNGSMLNHACVAKQVIKKHDILQVGIRTMDIDEHNFAKENESIHIVKGYDYSLERIKEILPKLKDKVYVTIDVDVFDPSFIRNTGTPEPGGLSWNQVINCLTLIFKEKEVIGADIVEFAPNHNFESESYALAKLVYKLMALGYRE